MKSRGTKAMKGNVLMFFVSSRSNLTVDFFPRRDLAGVGGVGGSEH